MPTMMTMGRSGDTSMISMLPYSFSRAMLIEVSMAETSMSTMVSTPGTKRKTLFISGLKCMRCSTGMISTVRFDGSRATHLPIICAA